MHGVAQQGRFLLDAALNCSAMCRYEFRYKQAVESTDVFLGMSGKTESSTSCEDLVVRIMLPEVSSISEHSLSFQRRKRRCRKSSAIMANHTELIFMTITSEMERRKPGIQGNKYRSETARA
eukprot:1158848-Pelagomonas_calceolata.AAC.2